MSTSASQLAASAAPEPATIAGRSAEASSSTSSSTASGSAAAARTTEPGAAWLAGSPAGALQSSIGAMTIAGPLPRDGFVVRAADRPGKVLRANRLVDPDRILAGERAQPTRQERLVCQVAPILLTDEDDERRPVDARGRERADRVAEPCGRMQQRERGLSASDRPAGRDTDDRCLVKREHELEIVRKTCQERHLGRPRVGKQGRESPVPKDLDDRVTDRWLGHALDSR